MEENWFATNHRFIAISWIRPYNKSFGPFCVPAKVTKLVGLKNGGLVSPTNLITFAGTQNGE